MEPFSNLTYQLDVITNLLPWESQDSYKLLWKQEFLSSSQDREMLDLWEATRNQLKQTPIEKPYERWPIENPLSRVDMDERVRAAGLDAANSKQFQSDLSKFAGPTSAQKLARVTSHFEKRFLEWWNREPATQGKVFQSNMKELLSSEKVRACLNQFESFYQPSFGKPTTLPFVLMYKPKLVENEQTSGQQLSRHAIVQFEPGEKVERRIDVVIHEYCHFLYQSGSRKNHVELQNRFLGLRDPAAIPAFNLLNEGIATTLGNGILAEVVDPVRSARIKPIQLSWYGKEGIDRTAKSVYSWMKDDLKAGRNLFDPGFVEKYVQTLKKEFGSDLVTPKYFFIGARVIVESPLGPDVFGYVRESLNPSSLSAEMDQIEPKRLKLALDRGENLSTLVALTPEKWNALSPLLNVKSSSEAPLIYCWMPPSRVAPVYFVVAKEKSEISRLIASLAKFDSVKAGFN